MKNKNVIVIAALLIAFPFLIFWRPIWYRNYEHTQYIQKRITELEAINIDEEFKRNSMMEVDTIYFLSGGAPAKSMLNQ